MNIELAGQLAYFRKQVELIYGTNKSSEIRKSKATMASLRVYTAGFCDGIEAAGLSVHPVFVLCVASNTMDRLLDFEISATKEQAYDPATVN